VVAATHAAPDTAGEVTVHGDGLLAEALEAAATRALAPHGWGPARERSSGWTGLVIDGAHLVLTDGRPAWERSAALGISDVAVFDLPLVLPHAPGAALAFAVSAQCSPGWAANAAAWLHALGFTPLQVTDAPALVVARTVAMLVNEAADAVQQGVCSTDGADAAMKLGVNYPTGPFEWLEAIGPGTVIGIVQALDASYRGERYRVSPWLRRRAAASAAPPEP